MANDKKKEVKVRDLKPSKDAKGGVRAAGAGHQNAASQQHAANQNLNAGGMRGPQGAQ